MELRLQCLILIGCIGVLLGIINMIRKEKLQLKYSLLWILMSIGIFIMCVIPRSIDIIAGIMGVVTPINALFFLGLVAVLAICFSLTVAQSRNAKKVKELAQRVAILEKKVEDERIKNEK